MANINKIRLSGTTYNLQDSNATKTVELTQAQYDALTVKDPNTFYIITDAQGADLSQYYTSAQTESAITQAVSGKQDTLISGTNIKTINNESLLGSGNIVIQGGGGSASSAITSGDTNPVQGGVLFDELRIPITGEVETLLEWDNHDEGETTNYPLGCSKIKIYVDESQGENGYVFWETDWESVGEINIIYNNGNVTVNNYSNVTYTIDGNVVTVNYPSIAADVTKIYTYYDNYWTVKAYTSGIVYEPLIDQVSANTISIQGKQDTLSAGTGINITDNVISVTGGGGGTSYSAGTGIEITNDVISVSGVVMSSEVTSAVTSGSTDVVTSGGVYDQLGGMKIVKLTESEYTALVTKDSNTLYCVVPDPSN